MNFLRGVDQCGGAGGVRSGDGPESVENQDAALCTPGDVLRALSTNEKRVPGLSGVFFCGCTQVFDVSPLRFNIEQVDLGDFEPDAVAFGGFGQVGQA